jgi:hypothetical protein
VVVPPGAVRRSTTFATGVPSDVWTATVSAEGGGGGSVPWSHAAASRERTTAATQRNRSTAGAEEWREGKVLHMNDRINTPRRMGETILRHNRRSEGAMGEMREKNAASHCIAMSRTTRYEARAVSFRTGAPQSLTHERDAEEQDSPSAGSIRTETGPRDHRAGRFSSGGAHLRLSGAAARGEHTGAIELNRGIAATTAPVRLRGHRSCRARSFTTSFRCG